MKKENHRSHWALFCFSSIFKQVTRATSGHMARLASMVPRAQCSWCLKGCEGPLSTETSPLMTSTCGWANVDSLLVSVEWIAVCVCVCVCVCAVS